MAPRPLSGHALKFYELCRFLDARGFRPVDMHDVLYRPKDQALWGMDLFFIPTGRPEFADDRFA